MVATTSPHDDDQVSAAELAPEQLHLIPYLDRYERIDLLNRIDGFLPVTKREQVEFMALQHDRYQRAGGAAAHLADITRSRRGVDTDDPQDAARSLTHSYIEWILDAQRSRAELKNLAEVMSFIRPDARLTDAYELDDPEAMGGFLRFMRFFDLSMLAQMSDVEAVGYDPQNVEYVPENGFIMAQAAVARESWKVVKVTKKLPEAIDHQEKRQTFWRKRLVEVARYSRGKLQIVAQEGIATVNGVSPAVDETTSI